MIINSFLLRIILQYTAYRGETARAYNSRVTVAHWWNNTPPTGHKLLLRGFYTEGETERQTGNGVNGRYFHNKIILTEETQTVIKYKYQSITHFSFTLLSRQTGINTSCKQSHTSSLMRLFSVYKHHENTQ